MEQSEKWSEKRIVIKMQIRGLERNVYQLCMRQARLSLLRVVNLVANALFMGKPLVTEACSDAENRDLWDLPHVT